ncbi:MAG: magnesium transporter [Clostridia bacterium]|nr:magnesium transporter [Clostridia bacterium]
METIYRLLPSSLSTEAFVFIPDEGQEHLVREFDEDERTEQARYLLQEHEYAALRDMLVELTPQDIASLLSEMPEASLFLLYRLLPKELAAEVFVEMDGDEQELLIKAFSDRELKEIIDELYLDDTVDIVEEMPATVVRRILKQTDPDTRKWINEILNYPKDSVGSIMTIEYVDLKGGITVADAFTRIRRTGVDKETIYTCYVTDPNRKLLGYVTAKDLMLADQTDLIEDIMEPNVLYVSTLDDQEEAVRMINRYDLLALPVVDGERRLVGIVTIDDAMDVMEEEATEDIEKMAAITPSERPYLKAGVWSIWAQRIPWLLLMMLSATFTGTIISSYEASLATVPVLTMFIPMLMGTGGNAGSQTSVTVIRGLALGEIEMGDILRALFKELRVSIICGLALAVGCFLKILLIDNLLFHSAVSIPAALVVCITTLATVVAAKLVGCALPILAKRLGFDPAVMASPFITTVVDAISLVIYFSVATWILQL